MRVFFVPAGCGTNACRALPDANLNMLKPVFPVPNMLSEKESKKNSYTYPVLPECDKTDLAQSSNPATAGPLSRFKERL